MNDRVPRRWFRFRLRTLLLIVVLAALAAWGVRQYRAYLDRKDTRPLETVVAAYNARVAKMPGRYQEKPLTADEVVTAIRAQLPTINADEEIKGALAKIARTWRVPPQAQLSPTTGYAPNSPTLRPQWQTDLVLRKGPRKGYVLRIRTVDDPAALDLPARDR